MSHLKERSEKSCLNCNADVHGRYCHVCGQENVEPVETAGHLIKHFFYDLTHFDGKFFSTLGKLIWKPGFLSAEYVAGRRARYLNPIRMYIFTSAFFFLLAFMAFTFEPGGGMVKFTVNGQPIYHTMPLDSLEFEKFNREHPEARIADREIYNSQIDSLKSRMHFFERSYSSREEYDSLLRSGEIEDVWLKRQWVYKEIEANNKYGKSSSELFKDFVNRVLHALPQLLFLSLPLFALVLKLLYWRQKRFYYAAHLIFSINLYIFAFIMMLFIIGVVKLEEVSGARWISYLKLLLIALIFFYEYKSLRRFYGQRRFKTIIKFFLLNVAHIAIILLLIAIGSYFTLMNL